MQTPAEMFAEMGSCKPSFDERCIAFCQKAIVDDGWQWREMLFNDGAENEYKRHNNCSIELTRDTKSLSFMEYPRPADCIGWGRFPRAEAWVRAYRAIILEKKYPKQEKSG